MIALNPVLQAIVLPLLLYQFIQIIKNRKPYPKLKELRYCAGNYSLVDNHDNESFYSSKRLVYDMEIFFLIELKEQKRRKLLVLFHDQLTKEEYRLLNVIEKIA